MIPNIRNTIPDGKIFSAQPGFSLPVKNTGGLIIYYPFYLNSLLSDISIRTKVLQVITICNSRLKLGVSKTQ